VDSERWKSVDAWFADRLVGSDEGLDHALIESDRAGLRQISVSHNQGKLLYLLARMVGARRILEIGTLGGYSGIWFARALPADGILVTLEIDPKTAEVARSNFAHAGVDQRVDVRVGAAVDSLQSISDEHQDRAIPIDDHEPGVYRAIRRNELDPRNRSADAPQPCGKRANASSS